MDNTDPTQPHDPQASSTEIENQNSSVQDEPSANTEQQRRWAVAGEQSSTSDKSQLPVQPSSDNLAQSDLDSSKENQAASASEPVVSTESDKQTESEGGKPPPLEPVHSQDGDEEPITPTPLPVVLFAVSEQ